MLQRYIQVINLEYRGKRNAYFDLQFFQIDIVPQIQLEANSLLSRNQKKLEKKGQINAIHQKIISKNMTKIAKVSNFKSFLENLATCP